jgi:protein-tyrosine-phosphatase
MPNSVLFACNLNAVRSPMCAAIARHYFGRRMSIDCVGVEAGELDPFAVAVMTELGIDIAKYKPKSFEAIADKDFDLIITLSPEAHHRALNVKAAGASSVEYWPTQDPSLAIELGYPREAILAAYRQVRDQLQARIIERLSTGRLGDL